MREAALEPGSGSAGIEDLSPVKTVAGMLLSLVLLSVPSVLCAAADEPGPPVGLRCEYFTNYLGMDVKSPRLSWQLGDSRRGARQTACQVLVAEDLADLSADKGSAWDSGRIESGESIHVVYAGKPLESCRRYFWKVRTWDAAGKASSYSEPAWWEMGLLAAGDWAAKWITVTNRPPEKPPARPPASPRAAAVDRIGEDLPIAEVEPLDVPQVAAPDRGTKAPAQPAPPPVEKSDRRALCFRREFSLAAKPVRARLYASGLGVYELRINGRRVGADLFNPGWTQYGEWIEYATYDVTRLLADGPNCVAAMVGSGWWNGMGGGGRSRPRLLLELRVEEPGGRLARITTDETWKATEAPILADAFYHGEDYDARLEQPGWDRPGFNDALWRAAMGIAVRGKVLAQSAPPIQVTDELRAVAVTEPKTNVFVFDFGQNASGVCRLKVRGAPAGASIRIRHAEVLNADGTIYTANYRGARATDTYICRGGEEEVWQPAFTYRGFRYAELTGHPGKPAKDALTSVVFHSACPPSGRFECSSDLLNRFFRATLWGQRSNLHSVPTDCPQRDERLGWTGDAQTFATTACWNMDMAAFFAHWLRFGPKMGNGPGWSDFQTVVPWTLFQFYGDRRILEDEYGKMTAFVDGMTKAAKDGLYPKKGYGDWIAAVGSPSEPIGAAYYHRSANLLSRMAAVLGRNDDAAKYAQTADIAAAAFNKAYLNRDTGAYPAGTQTAQAIPLAFGLVPSDVRAAVASNLVAETHRRNDHPTTGFLGTPVLLPVLTGIGEHELAYKLATQKTCPSWGYMVENGGTTVWELWNSDKAGPGMNSRNHFALGAVVAWYYETLAGINPMPWPENMKPAEAAARMRPAFARMLIAPRPAGDLKWVKAEYISPYGPVRSAWRLDDDGSFSLSVQIPPNTSAELRLPVSGRRQPAITESGKPAEQSPGVKFVRAEKDAAVYDVGAGAYEFKVTGN